MSLGISAHGSILSWQATPGGAFTEVGQLMGDLIPPEFTRNRIDTTTHNDDIDSSVLGVLRRGDLELHILFVKADATHNATTGLLHAIITNLKTGFKVTYPDTTVWVFSGGVSKFGMKAPVDGAFTADVSVAPDGIMTIDGNAIG